MATKWQRINIPVNEKFKPAQREQIAQEVIDFIIKRTTIGNDKKNKPFVRYEKDYEKKKGQKNVDLVLSFDMLSSLHLLSHKKGNVRIGFTNGTKQNGKADGNIRGTYGQSAPIPGKARDFLGIYKKDVKQLEKKI